MPSGESVQKICMNLSEIKQFLHRIGNNVESKFKNLKEYTTISSKSLIASLDTGSGRVLRKGKQMVNNKIHKILHYIPVPSLSIDIDDV